MKMFWRLVRKEWKENRFVITVWLLVSGVAALAIPLSYDYLWRLVETSPILPQQPQVLDVFRDYRIYLWSQWFGKNAYQNATIFAVLLGMGMVAGEAGRKTIDFLLSKPVSRALVWAAKFAAAGLALWLGLLISWAGLLLASLLKGRQVAWSWYWQGLPGLLAGSTLLLAVVAISSTLFPDRIKAGAAAVGIFLVLSIPSWIPNLRWLSVFHQMAGHEVLQRGQVPWLTILVLLGLAAGLYGLGLVIFRRREF